MIAIELERHGALVREFEPGDEPEVQALFTACDEWFVAATGQPSMPGDVQSMYYSLPMGAELSTKRLLVVVRDGQVVGVVDAVLHHPADAACSVGQFLLHPDHRRQRLGAALAGVLLDRLRTHGITEVSAWAPPGYEPALEFLKTLGFALSNPYAPDSAGDSVGNRNRGPSEPLPVRATLSTASAAR